MLYFLQPPLHMMQCKDALSYSGFGNYRTAGSAPPLTSQILWYKVSDYNMFAPWGHPVEGFQNWQLQRRNLLDQLATMLWAEYFFKIYNPLIPSWGSGGTGRERYRQGDMTFGSFLPVVAAEISSNPD